jgi:hypothetical protein
MSPFAARAAARAAARYNTEKSVAVSPRSERSGRFMRSITAPSTSGFDKVTVGMSNQERIAAKAERTKLCKHFLLGCCPHGDKCTYTHDISVMKSDEQKVFIGGIPGNCTSRQLINAIEKVGFKVLNIPKCHPSGFAPKVCLESVEHAKELLKIARIEIEGCTADVRKFSDSRSNNVDNMCVVVSGLPEGTSGRDLMEGLESAGFLIERSPLVQAGETVCQRCEMATVEQADVLVALSEISMFGTTLSFSKYASTTTKTVKRKSTRSFGRKRAQGTNAFLNRAVRDIEL